MKKFMALMMVLLLMFSMMLTGCGGGAEEPAAEEPAATEEPAAEEPAAEEISKNDLSIKYNEVATLYNEVFTLMNEKGIYGVEENTTAALDTLNSTMVGLGEAIAADDLSAEQKESIYASLDDILTGLGDMKAAAESM